MLDMIRTKTQSFVVKLIFGIIILVFIFWGVGNFSVGSGGLLAKVNGYSIMEPEFGKAFGWAFQAQQKANPDLLSDEAKLKEFKQAVLEQLIGARLRLQEAEKLGLLVTPHELKQYIDTFGAFQDESGKFDAERYKIVLAANRISPGEFEDDSRDTLLEAKLMRYVSLSGGLSEEEAKQLFAFLLEKRTAQYVLFSPASFVSRIELGDDEINAFYENNKERFRTPLRADIEYLLLTPESLAAAYPVTGEEVEVFYNENLDGYKRPASYQARHIFIASPPDGSSEPGADEAIAKAGAKLAEVKAKLKAGEDFSAVATQYSEDPQSAEAGGWLGWIEAGSPGAKELDQAALALKPGEVGDPVRSPVGYHIVRLEDKKAAHTVPLVEVRNSIEARLSREKAEADLENAHKLAEDGLNMGSPLADIGKNVKAEVKSSGFVSQEELEKLLGLHNDSRLLLADALAKAAVDGQPDTIAVPLNVSNGSALVRVVTARPSEIPPLAEVKEIITAELQADKARETADKEAAAALPAFIGKDLPEAYKDMAAVSQPAIRVFPAVEPLGVAQGIVDAIFDSAGAWLPRVYESPKGPVIVRTESVLAVTEEEWAQLKDIFIAQNQQQAAAAAMQAFELDMYGRARVERYYDRLDAIRYSER